MVTSQVKEQHVADLEELFTIITKYKLKLNPQKMCVWGRGRKVLRVPTY